MRPGSDDLPPAAYGGLAEFGRTLAHPVRIAVLSRAVTAERVSPRRLCDQLEEPLGTVSYHVRWLAKAGLIEITSTVQRRGAVEHFYAVTARGRRVWTAITALDGLGADGRGA